MFGWAVFEKGLAAREVKLSESVLRVLLSDILKYLQSRRKVALDEGLVALLEGAVGGAFLGLGFVAESVPDFVDINGFGFALGSDAIDVLHLVALGIAETISGVSCDQERGTVFFGESFDTGGEVDAIAEDGAAEALFAADGSKHQEAGVKADADVNRGFVFGGAFGVVDFESFEAVDGGLKGIIGLIEKGHDSIADVLVDKSVVFGDGGFHGVEVAVDELHGLCGRHAFDERCKRPNIRKESGHFALILIAALDLSEIFASEVGKEFDGDKALDGVVHLVELAVAGFEVSESAAVLIREGESKGQDEDTKGHRCERKRDIGEELCADGVLPKQQDKSGKHPALDGACVGVSLPSALDGVDQQAKQYPRKEQRKQEIGQDQREMRPKQQARETTHDRDPLADLPRSRRAFLIERTVGEFDGGKERQKGG